MKEFHRVKQGSGKPDPRAPLDKINNLQVHRIQLGMTIIDYKLGSTSVSEVYI